MNILEILLGQVPEAIFFAMFMILTKSFKERKCIFISLMIVEYLALKSLLTFNVWFQVAYTVMTYLTLKVVYKDKAQITDIFTFGIASIVLVLSSMITFLIFRPSMLLVAITNRILLFVILYFLRNKLPNIQKVYNKYWNRNDVIKKKMKSTTFRALNLVVFDTLFYVINLGMTYMLFLRR